MHSWTAIAQIFGEAAKRVIPKIHNLVYSALAAGANQTQVINIPVGRKYILLGISINCTGNNAVIQVKANGEDIMSSPAKIDNVCALGTVTPYPNELPFPVVCAGGSQLEIYIRNDAGVGDTFNVSMKGVDVID